MTPKELERVVVDPQQRTADINVENNFWPRRPEKSRFQLFKETRKPNAMQAEKEAEEKAKKEAAEAKAKAVDGGAKRK